ncbi:MATE family efflux transporter [Microcoleus sp. FACHB-1515]|nr:MATE family efflux transporter [Microcoleus sp. FACHB-1515]
MVPLAGLADVAFLGHLEDIRHLAGVALATVLFNYLYWTFGFLRMATTGMTAQAVGRQDADGIMLVGLRNGLLAIAIGLAIVLLQTPIQAIGFALLSATPEVEAAGLDYYRALIWGAPATLLNFVLIGWLLGREQGSRVLILSIVGNGVDVTLNYLMIVRWGWGSVGAGASTALSQYAMLIVGLALIFPVTLPQRWQNQLLDRTALQAAFRLNGDILIRTFALISTFALFTNLSSSLGTLILATNSLLLQVVTLAAYFIDGIAFATESFAGQFHGQQDRSQLTRLLQVAGISSLLLGLTFGILFAIQPIALFRLLTNHDDILAEVPRFAAWLIPVLGFGGIAYMLDGYFLGLTAGATLRRSSLIASLIGFAPIALLAWNFHSPHLLWLALSGFMAGRAMSLALRVPATLRE